MRTWILAILAAALMSCGDRNKEQEALCGTACPAGMKADYGFIDNSCRCRETIQLCVSDCAAIRRPISYFNERMDRCICNYDRTLSAEK